MYPRKNLAALLRATVLLVRELPELRVRLVGDGPERASLERLTRELSLESRVTFLGHVRLSALAAEYAACTVFCLPSLQEGFGLVFVEAMAAGKPIVALAASSTPELITDGVHGRLVPPGNDAALAGALRQLLDNPSLRQRVADANRTRAREFTIDHMTQQFIEAVRPLVPHAPGSRPGSAPSWRSASDSRFPTPS